jgi:hypothetical protein
MLCRDISYNDFTGNPPSECQQANVYVILKILTVKFDFFGAHDLHFVISEIWCQAFHLQITIRKIIHKKVQTTFTIIKIP